MRAKPSSLPPQSCLRQPLFSMSAGHSLPPFTGKNKTVRVLWLTPTPQRGLQGPQSDQGDTSQSRFTFPKPHGSFILSKSGQQSPALSQNSSQKHNALLTKSSIPQLLFRPLQQITDPPSSLLSQHCTDAPSSFCKQTLLAKVDAKCNGYGEHQRKVFRKFHSGETDSNRYCSPLAGRLEWDHSACVIYPKIGGVTGPEASNGLAECQSTSPRHDWHENKCLSHVKRLDRFIKRDGFTPQMIVYRTCADWKYEHLCFSSRAIIG